MTSPTRGLWIAVALLVLACSPPPDRPPNVLFIVVDDLNAHLGSYGRETVRSPNIDRLAAAGVRFDRAYAQYPLCVPSRTSFLSGRYPEQLGVYRNAGKLSMARDRPPLLPEWFRTHGYRTARAGKVFKADAEWGLPPGVEEPPEGSARPDSMSEEALEEARLERLDRAEDFERAERESAGGPLLDAPTRDSRAVGRAIEYLEEESDLPFFLMVGLDGTHPPFRAHPRFTDLYPASSIVLPEAPASGAEVPMSVYADRGNDEAFRRRTDPEIAARDRRTVATYYASVTMVDEEIGLLLSALDRLGLRDDTIVVLVGDHGFHLGEHGIWRKGTLFEESTRSPMILAGPGLPTETTVSAPTELLDLFPTVIDLADLPIPEGVQGRNLRPRMSGEEVGDRPAYSIVRRRDNRFGRSIRTGRYRYTEWDGEQLAELYDHQSDPRELVNLAPQAGSEDLLREMSALLAETRTRARGSKAKVRDR